MTQTPSSLVKRILSVAALAAVALLVTVGDALAAVPVDVIGRPQNVPEPATIALVGLGLAVLGRRLRRR